MSIETLEKNMINIHGTKGEKWIESLKTNLDKICRLYEIENLVSVNNMTFNYVASGEINNQPVILKFGINEKALQKEALTLKSFSDFGGVKCITSTNNIIIMERAIPGVSLKATFPDKDETSTIIMCELLKKLHRAPIPANNNFHRLDNLFTLIDEYEDLPASFLKKARKLKKEMFAKNSNSVLLHGDLHHDNILHCGSDYVAIDPHGFIGPSLYDVTTFIINPIPDLIEHTLAKQIIESRIITCKKQLNVDADDIVKWTYLKAIICWIWARQDSMDDGYSEKIVSLLFEL